MSTPPASTTIHELRPPSSFSQQYRIKCTGLPGKTAAEIVYQRADSTQENMGLTNWTGNTISKSEAGIAKNYLNSEELDILNRIVTAYLEFAEIQALERKPMYMSDWIAKLDDFLKLSGRELLTHAGTISHKQALTQAQLEYEKHRTMQINLPSPVETNFEQAIKQLPKPKPKKKG